MQSTQPYSSDSSLRFALFAIAMVLLLIGCNGDKSTKNVDVSNINVSLHIDRFEQDFFSIDSNNYQQKQEELGKRYGVFYSFYKQQLMQFNKQQDSGRTEKQAILAFLQNQSICGLYDTVSVHYAHIDLLEKQLTDAFKHLKYYFPEKNPPIVNTVITEFANGAFTFDTTTLGLGLDMYLGAHYVYYQSIGFPDFIIRKMEPQFILPNCMDVLYNLYFGDEHYDEQKTLVEAMVDKGKKLYFIENMLPSLPDSTLIGFTAAQEEWCRKSEYSIWQFFSDQDLLYKKNFMDQKRFLDDGPTTAGMPLESPGNVGTWVGWQIVRTFMHDAGGKISLKELVTQYDSKTILKKVNYKPKKS